MLIFRCLTHTECPAKKILTSVSLCFDEEIPSCCIQQTDAIPVSIQERDLFNLIATMPEYAHANPCDAIRVQAAMSARSDMAHDLGMEAVCEWNALIKTSTTTSDLGTLSA